MLLGDWHGPATPPGLQQQTSRAADQPYEPGAAVLLASAAPRCVPAVAPQLVRQGRGYVVVKHWLLVECYISPCLLALAGPAQAGIGLADAPCPVHAFPHTSVLLTRQTLRDAAHTVRTPSHWPTEAITLVIVLSCNGTSRFAR
jgi:hypothetical protein